MSEFGNTAGAALHPEMNEAGERNQLPPEFAKYFTALPQRNSCTELAKIWRKIWKQNAIDALTAAESGLRVEFPQLVSRVKTVDLDRPLDPRLFARLSSLMNAMNRQDAYAVADCIQGWCEDSPSKWHANRLKTESIAVHAWETPLLNEIRSTPQVNGASAIHVLPTLGRDLREIEEAIGASLDMVRRIDKEMYAEIKTHINLIKLFDGQGIEGLSSPTAFGAVWIKSPAPESAIPWFLEHLVHECSHLHLNILFALDPLMTNPQELNMAPIRPDPRPMFQILHGTFVLARNCRVHVRLNKRFPELKLQSSLEKFREQFLKGLAVLREAMKPTPFGQLLLTSLAETADCES